MKFHTILSILVLLLTVFIILNSQSYAQPMTKTDASAFTEMVPGMTNSDQATQNMRRVIFTPSFVSDCQNGQMKDRRGRCRNIFI